MNKIYKNKFKARLLFTRKQRQKLFMVIVMILYCAVLFPEISLIIILSISSFLFLSGFCVKFLLFIIGLFLKLYDKENPLQLPEEKDLPIYSLLIPLYK